MGVEKYYPNHCPSCGALKSSRKRDVGKVCKPCNMRAIELLFRHTKKKENPQTRAEANAKYRNKNANDQAYRLSKLYEQAKLRAKKRGMEFSIYLEDVIAAYPKDGLCPVFGITLGFNQIQREANSPSLDRIDSTKGYTKDNIRVVSWRVNRIKADATLQELEAIVAYMKQGFKE